MERNIRDSDIWSVQNKHASYTGCNRSSVQSRSVHVPPAMCIFYLRTVRFSSSASILFPSRLFLYLTQTWMAFSWCSSWCNGLCFFSMRSQHCPAFVRAIFMATEHLWLNIHLLWSYRLYEYNNFNLVDPQDLLRPPAYYGDVDIVAIFPILVSGCVMLLPILNWSDVVRKHEARAVVIGWGILMYLTMILTLRTLFRWTTPFIIFTQVSSCIINSTLGCTADDVIVHYSFISSNFYRK